MNTMTAADHRGILEFFSFRPNHLQQIFHILDKDISCLHHLHRERGIPHIGTG